MDGEINNTNISLVDQLPNSQKKEKKRSSSSQSPRSSKGKNSSKKTPSTDEGTTFDTQNNLKFVAFSEEQSGATKLGTGSANIRKDYHGNLISKGRYKKQKLTWADKIGNSTFPTIIDVESYKKYNIDVSAEKTDCNCACYIF